MAAGQLRARPRPRYGHAPRLTGHAPWPDTVRCAALQPRPLRPGRASVWPRPQDGPRRSRPPRRSPATPLSPCTRPGTVWTRLLAPPRLSASLHSRHAIFPSGHASDPPPYNRPSSPAHPGPPTPPGPSGHAPSPPCPTPSFRPRPLAHQSPAHSSQATPPRPLRRMQAQEGILPLSSRGMETATNTDLQTHGRKPQPWKRLEQTLSI